MSNYEGNVQGPVVEGDHAAGGYVPTTDRSAAEHVSYPQVSPPGSTATEDHGSSTFGAPPMGDPAEPSSHPDNQAAATEQTTPGTATDRVEEPVSGAAGAATRDYRQTPARPGMAGTATAGAGVGQQPGSPYVQTAEVPPTGKGPMNTIMENLNKLAAKAEGLAGNVWGHLRTGPSMRETAWGRMTHHTRLLTEGGFEGVYKQTFGMTNNEQLRKTYACYLSTSTGPVVGTLYISNLKFAFCSDRPLSYENAPGKQAWSYYKVVIPLDKVSEVVPSVNENKPNEKYIQVLTNDGHDFWFMGFVNYDKAVTNMQDALQNIGVVDPQGSGLWVPFSGNRNRDVPAQNMGQHPAQDYVAPDQGHPAPYSQAAGNVDRQPASDTTQSVYTN